MDRRLFLKSLVMGTAGVASMSVMALSTRESSKTRRQRLETHVAGLPYWAAIDGPLDEHFTEGQLLRVVREPSNIHDPCAVALHAIDGQKIGYVSRMDNAKLAADMDMGARAGGRIVEITRDDLWTGLRIEIEWSV